MGFDMSVAKKNEAFFIRKLSLQSCRTIPVLMLASLKRNPKMAYITSRDFSINSAHDRNVVLFAFVVLFNSCCICDVCLCASMWRHGPFDQMQSPSAKTITKKIIEIQSTCLLHTIAVGSFQYNITLVYIPIPSSLGN